MNSRPIFRLIGVVCSAMFLASCFTSASDFKSKAETVIVDQVGPEVETTFTSVSCEAPINQNIGTRFTCQAIDDAAGVWEFDNVIDAEGEFTVNISRRP
jgi:hypothetical protein